MRIKLPTASGSLATLYRYLPAAPVAQHTKYFRKQLAILEIGREF
jgi:hypothetical protein